MEGCCNHARTWPFASILAFALALTSDYTCVEMPKFTPLYLNEWALKPTWKF